MPFCDRAIETVTAVRNGSAVTLHLSIQVALKLGLRTKAEDRLGISYGIGEEHGKLKLGRAGYGAHSAVTTYPIKGGVALNLNPKFIDAALPRESVVLPHDLRGLYVLIDLTPLRTK